MSGEYITPQQPDVAASVEPGSGNALYDELERILGETPDTPLFHGFKDKTALIEADTRVTLFGGEQPAPEKEYLGWGTPDAQSDYKALDIKIKINSSQEGSEDYRVGVQQAEQYFGKFQEDYQRRYPDHEPAHIRHGAAGELLSDVGFVKLRQTFGWNDFIIKKFPRERSQFMGAGHRVINLKLLNRSTPQAK